MITRTRTYIVAKYALQSLVFLFTVQALFYGEILHFFMPNFHFPHGESRTIETLPNHLRDQYKKYAELDNKLHQIHEFEESINYIAKNNK